MVLPALHVPPLHGSARQNTSSRSSCPHQCLPDIKTPRPQWSSLPRQLYLSASATHPLSLTSETVALTDLFSVHQLSKEHFQLSPVATQISIPRRALSCVGHSLPLSQRSVSKILPSVIRLSQKPFAFSFVSSDFIFCFYLFFSLFLAHLFKPRVHCALTLLHPQLGPLELQYNLVSRVIPDSQHASRKCYCLGSPRGPIITRFYSF